MNASPAWSLSARLGQGPPILVFGIPVLGLTLPAALQEVGRLSLPLQFLGTLMMSFFFFFLLKRSFNLQLILKEVNPEYSLEGLMLKLKLQYFDHLL